MKGDFFAWLSHDDLFTSDKLRLQVAALKDSERENEILFSGYMLINQKGNMTGNVDFSSQLDSCNKLGGIERGLINGCTILMSKKIINQVGFFNEDLRYTQDYDYWLRCLMAGYSFKYMPFSLVKTRIHSEQDSRKHHKLAHLESENLWLRITEFWLSKESVSLDTRVREMMHFRSFLSDLGFGLAEQKISERLLNSLTNVRVSIVLPTAHRRYLLRIALESLRSQLHKNFEVVVVNDAPGTSLDIEPLLKESNLDYKYIENTQNLGAGYSRNIGVKHSEGEFVCFLDSDDFFLPDKISEQLIEMIGSESEISHSNYYSRSSQNATHTFRDTSRHHGENQAQFIANHGCTIATPTIMVRKELLDIVPTPFPNSHSAGEDISAWIILLNASHKPLHHIKNPLTVVRTHANAADGNPAAQRESQLLIKETLSDLGIVQVQSKIVRRCLSNHIKPRLILVGVEFLTFAYLRMPHGLREFLKRNKSIIILNNKLRSKAGF
jgi:glycosyltransferase involved in cell wall biosynthesis